ncbi:DUF2244 domain-containing protein [Rhodoligotrophos defluvii]|uniref:DUF2244 domain-containing protein n=1 Tax=Rhodoligotrophos defluvii TaxID=2561934 RepID=UPI0010C9D162|nr:DUF2244 domain-containing protein [Rhodoligotrophos defluvii]
MSDHAIQTGSTPGEAIRFSAILTPHRSLSQRGFLLLMLFFGGVSAVVGTGFLVMGAWPVFGFFGLDVALLYWAFRRNYQDGTMHEQVDITDTALVVRKVFPREPTKEFRFIPYWVRVELVENEVLETCGPLYLTSHGARLEIGSFLSPQERRDFAGALKAALRGGMVSVPQPA